MTTITWANPGTSGNWNDTTQWTGGVVPGANDDAVIPGNATAFTVTYNIATDVALDSITLGTGGGTPVGGVTLAVGANTLDATGSGAGATDAIIMNGSGTTITVTGGAVKAGVLATNTGTQVAGFGNLLIGNFGGSGGIVEATGGTLTIAAPLAANSAPTFEVAASSKLDVGSTLGTGNKFQFLDQNTGTIGFENDGGSPTEVIMNMAVGVLAATDVVDIENHTVTIAGASGSGTAAGTITLSDGTTLSLQFNTPTAWTPTTAVDGAGTGTNIFLTEPVCFCRGTLITTDRGDVPVEELEVGDKVRTLSGAHKAIKWIGFGRELVTRSNRAARPVIVRQGALGDNVPSRDLYVTHGHALYFDGVLIPVENLVNHRSIVWDDEAGVVEFYHVELEDHDVLFAEGAPAETYYDASNRARFQNTQPGSEAGPDKPTIVPVLNGGDVVERVWAELYERAGGEIGGATTVDPDLHLMIDGKRVEPSAVDGLAYTFSLEAAPIDAVALRSRNGVPSLLGITRHDHRQLGVGISQIDVRQAGMLTVFGPDAWLFRDGGAHPAENGYCWTDGELELPAEAFAQVTGPFTLTVHTQQPGMRYPADKAA